ncbi:class I SAM-dependent methyltransferase [Massilia sp. Dwa41.01b]|uniref:class I SAM-dependent methyltransferase n=1 Tax=Massilia sp. Dwa41.01b TaxID=2709302 RepID=UPI001E31EDC0|nr:class I SAM-dependent methyltransferase [Massilia sp. Dwa41.01b]
MDAQLDPQLHHQAEQERIGQVYRGWHGGAALARYAWHRPDVVRQQGMRSRVLSHMLATTLGTDLGGVRVIDVGCGTGGFLRQLIDWGATPAHLTGTELQQDRLDLARPRTAPEVKWVCGPLSALPAASADLVSAQTVLSSVLDPELRQRLASDMWRVLKPGGWCLVFDFRYNNPRNPHVRKVRREELRAYWPGHREQYQTLLLAPPLGRALAAMPDPAHRSAGQPGTAAAVALRLYGAKGTMSRMQAGACRAWDGRLRVQTPSSGQCEHPRILCFVTIR